MSGSGKKSGEGAHTIADHMLGDFFPHDHSSDADHDHDVIDPGRLEDNPIWQQDNVFLKSVGIDIGSAGTQVVFSGVHLRRHGEHLTSRYVIVERETLYESPVALTPYSDVHLIDAQALGAIIDAAYAAAKIAPDAVDTGVVILTGEALRRENAEGIADVLAEKSGDFVTATAGHHMEAMLAAYGSGAAPASFETGRRILNIDIGGGTTKLAVVDKGHVTTTAAIHIGGRLIVVAGGRVARLDPAGAHHAARAGFRWSLGSEVGEGDLSKVAEGMADLLVATLNPHPAPEVSELYLTDPPDGLAGMDGIMFSGGVGEYVYGREERDFGDLGRHLGAAIRRRLEAGAFGAPLLPAGACIRATALGASEYSVQLSGNTSCITNPGKLLPRRNLQVVKPDIEFSDAIDPQTVAEAIGRHLTAFDLDPVSGAFVLAFQWAGAPEYQRVRSFAEGIAAGLAERIAAENPLYIMLDGDIAQTLGGILRDEVHVGAEMLVIDGILLRDFDYIDLGRVRLPSFTVPVTIKSLLFREESGGLRRPERIHHHGHGHAHHHHHGEGDRGD
jgi:ethanolamine utilization protein EutA (predicted chaperonin)